VTRAVLLDIEGTIGDIAFVREILFPFARARIGDVLKARWDEPEIAAVVHSACYGSVEELLTPAVATRRFLQWMDEDKKVTPLKTLQGIVWREGYASGELKAHLYPDAVEAIQTWHKRGVKIAIYSSGSIEAQKLYFAHSVAGDLTPLLSRYFDTTTGAKGDAKSYAKIADTIGVPPNAITFFSDSAVETDAAFQAGFGAYRVDRTKPATFAGRDGTMPVIGSLAPLVVRASS
jgi:enolase-phosphatase E1